MVQTSAAGTEFYFTVFDHWLNRFAADELNNTVAIGISTIEETNVRMTGGGFQDAYHHIGANTSTTILLSGISMPLRGVHITSTSPCFVNVTVHGSSSGAASMILPEHLLGTRYMLYGVPSELIAAQDTYSGTYSQFSLVGTKNGTTVTVTPKAPLTCVTTGQTLNAPTTFTMATNEVLLFRPVDYTQSITGTYVDSDRPIAVFQGNNFARTSTNEDCAEYTWEQVRPLTQWGKEFVISKSSAFKRMNFMPVAPEENTVIDIYNPDGTKWINGWTLGEGFIATSLGIENTDFQTLYMVTSKPVACYLYTGEKDKYDPSDRGCGPSLAEIAPIDKPTSEARWNLFSNSTGAPYDTRLIVSTKSGNEANIRLNSRKLNSIESSKVKSKTVEGYISYEIPIESSGSGVLVSEGEGFSAYILQMGQNGEASAFNIAAQGTTVEEPCDGVLLFREDFGGNAPNDPEIGLTPVPGMDDGYTQSNGYMMTQGMYIVTKKGYRNGIQWHLQDDHTHFGDYSRGYFLEIDGAGDGAPFYRTTIDGLCAGSNLTFSAYVANVTYAGQIPYLQKNFGYIYPRLKFVLRNPATGQILAERSTGNILPDTTKVWNINLSESADWQLVGMNFTVPKDVEAVELTIYNDVSTYGFGDDFALDDIEVRLCLPPVSIEGTDSVCPHLPTELRAISAYQDTALTPLEYKWWHSADNTTWTTIAGATSPVLALPEVLPTDSGWYKVAMAAVGSIEGANCRSESEPFKLTVRSFIDCVPPVTIRSPHNVCEGRHYRFNVRFDNNGVVTGPIAYQWFYTSTLDPDIPADDNNWQPLQGPNGQVLNPNFDNILEADSGWYRIVIANAAYINDPDNRAVSEPFHLRVSADCPICTDGRLLFRESFGGSRPATYTRLIENTCAGTEFSILANIADAVLPTDVHLVVTLTDAVTREELKRYDADSTELDEWRQAGFNFGVPPEVAAIELTVTNDSLVSLTDLDFYLCAPTVRISANDTVCRETEHQFTAVVRNGVNDRLAFMEPLDYLWYHSSDQNTWAPVAGTTDSLWTIAATADADGGWYKVAVAEEGNVESDNCRVESEPFMLTIKKCLNPPQTTDTTVCDTLMPYPWHEILWQEVGDSDVMLHYTTGEDSVLMTYVLTTERCCPAIQYATGHLDICDTLLPYTWYFRDTAVTFADISDEHQVLIPHPRWTDCVGTIYTLTVDTFRCEKLWPVIVNKYNWQLLVNHTALHSLIPDRVAQTYQWYKDSVAIPGATADDYSEQNELHGTYQLLVWMNDGSYIWSNIIDIRDTREPQPVIMRIYNSNGMPVREDHLTRGVYIIHYQQGDRVWTTKKIVL